MLFHFGMRMSWNIVSSIACDSTIASNKQRPEHSYLALIWRVKLKGAHERSKSLQFVKNLEPKMQLLTRMASVVDEDYYHMTTMDKNVDRMTSTRLCCQISSKPYNPFCTSTFYIEFLILFLNVQEK